MMHHSGKHTIQWSPPLCKVYSSVAHSNGKKNGSRQGQKANTTVPTWSKSLFWPKLPDMREPPMESLLYIVCSITEHDHLMMNVV